MQIQRIRIQHQQIRLLQQRRLLRRQLMHQIQHVLKVWSLVTISGTPVDVFIKLGFAMERLIAMMDQTRWTVWLLLRTTMITTIMSMMEHGNRLMQLL